MVRKWQCRFEPWRVGLKSPPFPLWCWVSTWL